MRLASRGGLLFLLSLLLFSPISSQEIHRYDSAYSVREDVLGHARFRYEGDLEHEYTKQGSFIYEWQGKRVLNDTGIIEKEVWEGAYEDDLKNGDWQYEFERYNVKIHGIISNDLDYTLTSYYATLTANYDMGVPTGEWHYERYYRDKDKNMILESNCEITFNEGYVDGPVYYMLDDSIGKRGVQGMANKGFFNGIWRFHFYDSEQVRYYDHGILTKLINIDTNNLDTLIFPLSEQLQAWLADSAANPDALFNQPIRLAFKDGYPSNSPYVMEQVNGDKMLRGMLHDLAVFDPDQSKLIKVPLSSNRGNYPFSQEEKDMLQEWNKLYDKYRERLHIIENEEVINLSQSNDSTIVLVLNWLNEENKLMPGLAKKMAHPMNKRLEHIYREGIATDSAKSLMQSTTIDFFDEKITFNYSPKDDDETNILAYLLENMKGRLKVADSLHLIFKVKVKSLHLTNAIMLRNDKIIQLINGLDSTLDAHFKDPILNNLVNSVHDHYLEDIRSREYQKFLEEVDDKEHQAIMGDTILLELNAIENIYQLIDSLAKQRRYLDSMYTEYVFDPFTYTDRVPSRVKRRLYDVIANQMFTQMVNKATAEPDPIHCEVVLKDLYEVQAYLLMFRDEDTKKLEGKLRRHKDLDDRLKLLNEGLE